VIKKARERGGHSPRWAAEPEKKKDKSALFDIRLIILSVIYTILDIPPIRFIFKVTQKDLRSSLMMVGYWRNM
jgi:hypothetical protein